MTTKKSTTNKTSATTSATTSVENRVCSALEKIDADQSLNAWSFVDQSGALSAAKESDARRERGESLGPLDGRLLAVKANIAVKGWPWDAGIARLRSRVATEDAAIISHLRAAGAILLGLTRMDEAALGASGLSIDGPIRLPDRHEYSPGGSSGGAAIAVAAAHCEAAIGTDTIGSVRIPAALTANVALKPSRQALDLQGIEPLHLHYDTPGPIARSVSDLLTLFEGMRGSDESQLARESTVSFDVSSAPPQLLYLTGEALASLPATTRQRYEQAVEHLHLASTVQPARMPARMLAPMQASRLCDSAQLQAAIKDLPQARRRLFTLCESQLADHWRRQDPDVITAGESPFVGVGFSIPLQAMLSYGDAVTASKRAELERELQHFHDRWHQLCEKTSQIAGRAVVWLLPTTPVLEFRHQEGAPKELADWTCLASITGWPALSMPLPGAQSAESPTSAALSLQLVSADLDDRALCRYALEMSRDLLASRHPNALGTTDMQ